MFNLILFGPPGSGKGTQSIKIAKAFGLEHISTGDIFRSEIKAKTALGLKVQSVIESGELVSDELLVEILETALNRFENPKGFIFDGYPRTLVQAGDLDEILARKGTEVSLVLALDAPDEELLERLLKRAQEQGRKDDTEDIIKNRLGVYHAQTKPLIDYYEKKGKFESVYGVGSIDDIFNTISETIKKYL